MLKIQTMASCRCGRLSLRLRLALVWLSWVSLLLTTSGFTCPIFAAKHQPSLLRSSESEESHEVDRYRNRAALTESVLKEKVQEMKLLRGKVDILQDVVKKLQASQKESTLSASLQEKELTSQWREEETRRIEADLQIKHLKSELNKTRVELNMQSSRHAELVDKLKKDYNKDRQAWREEKTEFREREKVVQDKIRALQDEVLDMDQSLETTQGELMRVQRRLATREDELRSLVKDEERKRKVVEEKLEAALAEKNSLRTKLESYLVSEEERQESIDIASAAVRAAEKREASLREELAVLREQLQNLEANSSKSDMTMQSGDGNVERAIQKLTQELDSERTKREADLANNRQWFEEQLAAQEEKYEAQLRLLQSNATLTGSKNATQTGSNDTTLTDSKNASVAVDVPLASSKKRGGFWRRVRSPRSWLSRRDT